MLFDDSGLRRAFKTMSDRAEKNGKGLARKNANFFVRMARKISFQNAPDPIAILDLKEKYGNRIRRKPGVSVDAEIGRRISKIGTLARGWRILKTESKPFSIRIWIVDKVGYSKVVDDRQKLAEQAAAVVSKSFQNGLNKLAQKLTGDFSNGR